MGEVPLPNDDLEMWQWVRTPLPPKSEHRDFEILRRSLRMQDDQVSANGSDWQRLGPADRTRVRQMYPRFVSQHNPFIRHIVRPAAATSNKVATRRPASLISNPSG